MVDDEKNLTTGKILLNQFNSSWSMLHQAIENIPEKMWLDTKNDWSFSFNVYHIIETANFYIKNDPKDMIWGKRANIDWNNDSESNIIEKKSKITKNDLLIYLDETKVTISEVLESMADNELMSKDDFKWFNSIIEKLLYLLRHNMHHIGELNKTLRDYECKRIEWL
ncbi:MAG: DinB family protein [Candidatus Hodarchaeales archaeon]|jgi:hypothetical protein